MKRSEALEAPLACKQKSLFTSDKYLFYAVDSVVVLRRKDKDKIQHVARLYRKYDFCVHTAPNRRHVKTTFSIYQTLPKAQI